METRKQHYPLPCLYVTVEVAFAQYLVVSSILLLNHKFKHHRTFFFQISAPAAIVSLAYNAVLSAAKVTSFLEHHYWTFLFTGNGDQITFARN